MESEQTGLAFSLPPSPERVRANSPVEFLHDFLFPSPRARDTVSFGLDDILYTAASDSQDFGPALADALPPSGQEARPSAAYSELVAVLSRTTEKLVLDWPDEPNESQASKLDERFLSGAHSKPERRKLPFFSDLHQEIPSSWKQPFPSRLTNAAAADFISSAQPKLSRLLSSNSCRGDQGTIPLPPPLCLGSNRYPERSPLGVEPRPRALPPLWFGEPVAGLFPANNHASGLT